jgi:transposase
MLPVLNTFKKRYDLKQLIVVADSGLLSKDNIEKLISNNYEFILGARIKNEPQNIKDKILSLKLNNGGSRVIKKGDLRLIVTFSDDRAKKDKYNREKGLRKLEKRVKSGKLIKANINNRGYNKYLTLKGEVQVSIDYKKYQKDARWDGLKGYITNASA